MSDLSVFILARIAEDEASVVADAPPDGGPELAEGYRWRTLYQGGDAALAVSPARVLAECEAKRRIVDDATNQHTSCPELDEVLRALVAVYADHEDFKEEWR